jgi:YVTN family beta-propeller protein
MDDQTPAQGVRDMKALFGVIAAAAAVVVLTAACGASYSSAPAGIKASAKAQLFVFSNSSPNVSVIDAQTRKVTKTLNIPNFTSWTWNDDNNYFDGKDLWLGTLNMNTHDAEVITLNLDTLQVTHRIALGKEPTTLYIGKAAKGGKLLVAKGGAWQVAVIDTKTYQVMKMVDEPVNAGATGKPPLWEVCDIDVSTGADGVQRAYYPTWQGATVVSVDPNTLQPLKTASFPAGSNPWMLTVAPDGKVWVQEGGNSDTAVLDPITLAVVKRVPSGKFPVDVTFSPDGKFAYILHGGDPVISVVDTKTLTEVTRIEVGNNPQSAVAHPNGKFLYSVLTKEASVAVIDTASWTVVGRISLGTNPSNIFLRTVS